MSLDESKIPPKDVDDTVNQLQKLQMGTHALMIYPDPMTLRRIYAEYAKKQLEGGNEIVLILPYYENTEMVRLTLSGETIHYENGNNPFGYSGIDVNKYEKEGSLIIMDSLEGYFPSERQGVFNNDIPGGHLDLMSYLEILLKKAERQKKMV
jgi:hypothetical protein